jgi:hypothetical protein
MPRRETLITIEKITDCETGDYHVGELDFGIRDVPGYLKQYGYEGKRELLAMLGHLAYHVERYFQELPRSGSGVPQQDVAPK